MARFIGTRQADQCRSHHQKMEKKYLSFHGILASQRLCHFSSHSAASVLDKITDMDLDIREEFTIVPGETLGNDITKQEDIPEKFELDS
jgi:hypothetical protein